MGLFTSALASTGLGPLGEIHKHGSDVKEKAGPHCGHGERGQVLVKSAHLSREGGQEAKEQKLDLSRVPGTLPPPPAAVIAVGARLGARRPMPFLGKQKRWVSTASGQGP